MAAIIGLLAAGAFLVFLETILVGGVWFVAGVACHCAAAYLAYSSFGTAAALCAGAAAAASWLAVLWFWIYILPKTRLGKKIYLDTVQDGKSSETNLKLLVGKNAVALTTMTPSGKVEIDGKPYDALCESATAEAGDRLSVVGADSFRLVVRKI